MKRIPVISFVFLLMFGAAPCSAQKAEAPLSAAAAQRKQQVATKQFTHAEMVQFVHTLQTQAAGWKDTVNSVDPPAFRFNLKLMASVEREKKALLLVLDEIERLSLPASETNAATDLGVEFGVYTFLTDIACGAEGLSATLAYNSIDGLAKANELLQVQREALKAGSPLFQEILTRIADMSRSEKAEGCQ